MKFRVLEFAGFELSVMVILKLYCPVDAGVPKRTPAVDRDNPGGNTLSAATTKEYGGVPPDAVNG